MVLLEVLTAQRSKRRSGFIRVQYTLEMVRRASVWYSRMPYLPYYLVEQDSVLRPICLLKAPMRSDCENSAFRSPSQFVLQKKLLL